MVYIKVKIFNIFLLKLLVFSALVYVFFFGVCLFKMYLSYITVSLHFKYVHSKMFDSI